jgi:hypothetical protein
MLNFYRPFFMPYFGSHIENGRHLENFETQNCSSNGDLSLCHIPKHGIKIQHCSISSKFDMWVDNDVPNLFLTLKNFYRSPFSKWPPQYQFFNVGNQFGTSLSTHISNFDDIGQC